jgi:hypothetical protein
MAVHKRHYARQEAQTKLRATIAWWAAWQRHQGREDSESFRRFFHFFGVDVATAKTLGARDAEELNEKIAIKLGEYYRVNAG